MDNKNLITLAVVLAFILGFVIIFNNLLVDRITSRVLDELRRSYVPGPYDPSYDPDKVNPNNFR